jgi:hypothetical protein
MLKRWGVSSNHLYKGAVPYFPDFYRGTEWTFAIESGSDTDVSDLTAFIAIQRSSGQSWWSKMSQKTDMEMLTLGWATEYYTGHWDGYAVNRNNYFVNFDNNGKVVMVPWGVDQTWGGYMDYFSSTAVMTNKCWNYQPCLETYRQSMAKVSRIAKGLDLAGMAKNVTLAIKSAIRSDPFGPGLSTAEDYQANLIWRLKDQQRILSSIVAPFDTTLSSFRINNVLYTTGQKVVLPPGTETVSLTVTTSQPTAKATVDPIAPITPGLNTAMVYVTSADKQRTNLTKIEFYVQSNHTISTSVSHHANTAVPTFTGISSTGTLGTNLESAANLYLDIKMFKPKTLSTTKAKTLMSGRVKQLLATLASRGIKPTRVTQTLTSSGSANSIVISASFTK